MNSLLRIYAVLMKEIQQLRRDRLSMGMIFGIPMMQLLLFGYAINTDLRHLPAAVADQSRTVASRELVARVQTSQVLDIVAVVEGPEEIAALLRSGEVLVGIVIPVDYDDRLEDPSRTAAQIVVDGSDPTVVGAVGGLLKMPVAEVRFDQEAALFELSDPVNPERRSAIFVVPGLIGVILTMTMTLFTSVAVVRERERGNLEFLITTPIHSAELMLGKILPYVLIGLIQVTVILGLGALIFDVPVRGPLLDVYLASLVFITANLGLGLMISTGAQTQFQAMQMTFFFFLPSILLSGFMFPFAGMPLIAQHIAEVLPLTHFVRIIRAIMLKGATFSELARELAALGVFALISVTVASLRFRKHLD